MKIAVIADVDMEHHIDAKRQRLLSWFPTGHMLLFVQSRHFTKPINTEGFDITFLVGRKVQHLHKYIDQPFWLRGQFAGIPFPCANIDPTLARMTQSFIHNVIALFECMPDRPLDVPKELTGANIEQ